MTNANTAKNNANTENTKTENASTADNTINDNIDADTTTVENTNWFARNKKMLMIGAGLATVAAGIGAAAAVYKRATASVAGGEEEAPIAAE